jgi:hypothetical protein
VLLISTESEDFWLGNNPRATGHTLIDSEHTVFMSLPPDERDDLYRQPNEMAQADWFSQRARAFVKAHPGEFFRLWALKFFHFWWYAPQTGGIPSHLVLPLYDLLLRSTGSGGSGRGANY